MAIKPYVKDGKKLFQVIVMKRDQFGRQVCRKRNNIPSERKAADVEFELRKELEDQTSGKPSMMWKGWVEHCLARMKFELMPSSVMNYQGGLEKWVNPIWNNRLLSEITRAEVHRLVFEELQLGASPHARRNALKMIKRVFQMAVDDGYLDRNPCAGITVKVPESDQSVLTSSEVQTFLAKARAHEHEFYPVWVVAVMTGMRSGEMFALEWSDVDFETMNIRVTKQWTSKNGITPTKTRKCRTVPISQQLAEFLKEFKLQSKAWFPNVLPRISEWERGEQAKVTRDFCEAIGITSVKFHDLRATFITNLLSKGVSLARVMAIVGHSEIKTTNYYLRKAGVDLQGATDALGYDIPVGETGQVLQINGEWGKR